MNRLKWLIKLANKMIRGTTYPLVCVPIAPVKAVLTAHTEKANTETKLVTSVKSNL
jgi:hypothetical protein